MSSLKDESSTTLDFHGSDIDSKNVQYYVGQGAMNSNTTGEGGQYQKKQGTSNSTSSSNNNSTKAFLPWTQCFCCIPIQAYQKYFDFDTRDILQRIQGSILYVNKPDYFREELIGSRVKKNQQQEEEEEEDIEVESSTNNPTSNHGTHKGPDLYAPIWIAFTLIFLVAVTSNATAYLHSYSTDIDFEYDITHLTNAVILLFSYILGLPTFFYFVLKFIRVHSLSWVDLVCLYGYSLVPYIPAIVLCLIPSIILEWILLLTATTLSVLLILRNISSPILQSSDSNTRAYGSAILTAVMLFHLAFLFTLKFGFYHHPRSSSGSIVPPSSSTNPSSSSDNSTNTNITKDDDGTPADAPSRDQRFLW